MYDASFVELIDERGQVNLNLIRAIAKSNGIVRLRFVIAPRFDGALELRIAGQVKNLLVRLIVPPGANLSERVLPQIVRRLEVVSLA